MPISNLSTFGIVIDLIVVVAYFVTVIYVGLKFAEKEGTLESFALGGRSIPWWAVLASIIAAETSAATFLGTPGEGYQLVSYAYLQLVFGTIIGRLIVAFLFIKPFYDQGVYSIYEYLQNRFGKGTRAVASAIFLFTRVLASGARLYVAAIILAVGFAVFTHVQPTSDQQLWLYVTSIVVLTVVTTIYTSVGGIKAVVWTDCIQSSVMIAGAIGAIAVLIHSTGAAAMPIHATSAAAMPVHSTNAVPFYELIPQKFLSMITTGTVNGAPLQQNLVSVLTSDYTIWAGIFGMSFATLATHGTDQDMVQRMLTAKDYKKSQLSLVLSGLADLPIGFIFLTIGILLNLFYAAHGDPGLPTKTNEVFAYFILKEMPIGLRGLLVAGIFATSMGSLSAALNALATSFTRDWYQQIWKDSTDAQSVSTVRLATYVFAVLVTIVACATVYFVIAHPESRIIPIVLGIFGYTYGSLLGIFLLGLLTKTRGNDRGNYIAMVVGFTCVATLTGLPDQILNLFGLYGIPALSSIPKISFPWRIMFGSIATFAVGCLFSTKKVGRQINL